MNPVKKIRTVGVVGAGTMGSALAQKFAQEHFKVILADRDLSFVQKGIDRIHQSLEAGVAKKVFTSDFAAACLSNIKGTASLQDLSQCDLLVEAIFEDFKVKSELFSNLDKIVDPTTILATNTSSFLVTKLAEQVSNPERFIGLHYFYHAAKNRLVEIIPGEKTSPEVIEAAKIFCVQSGKDAIHCRDSYGFVVNRFFVPWLNESVRLLEEGIGDIPTIDDVGRKVFGISMGPFALMNATGIPVAYHAQKTMEVFGEFYHVSPLLKKQVESGKQWELSGEPSADTETRKIIRERLLGTAFLISAQLLDEKVCQPIDINRGARIGLKWEKGPVELMKECGPEEVSRLIEMLVHKYSIQVPASTTPSSWHLDYVELEKRDDNAIITINRPEDLNALNEDVIRQLETKFRDAEKDPAVKTIFITGAGKAFVAGADIKYFVNKIKAKKIRDIESFTAYGQFVFNKIDKSPKKVVAVLNGLALGGGLELALCADIILAFPSVRIAFPETGIGIYPALGGTLRCKNKIGTGLSKFLVHTGRALNATEALETGLVDALITHEEMIDIFSGAKPVPVPDKVPLNDKWKSIACFFTENPLSELMAHNFHNHCLNENDAESIFRNIRRKAPLALNVAEKLIDEATECDSELIYLKEIFSTGDALLGLSNVGKPVEFRGN